MSFKCLCKTFSKSLAQRKQSINVVVAVLMTWAEVNKNTALKFVMLPSELYHSVVLDKGGDEGSFYDLDTRQIHSLSF